MAYLRWQQMSRACPSMIRWREDAHGGDVWRFFYLSYRRCNLSRYMCCHRAIEMYAYCPVNASIAANTWVVSGIPMTKEFSEILLGIGSQLKSMENLEKLAEQLQKQGPGGASAVREDDNEVP